MNMTNEKILEIIHKKDPAGMLSRQKYLEKHYPSVLKYILDFASSNNFSMPIGQTKWHIVNNAFKIPTCKECGKILKFKNATIGYPSFCSPRCTSKNKDSQQKLRHSMLKNHGVTHSSLTKKSIVSRHNKKINTIKSMCQSSHIEFIDLDKDEDIIAKCNNTNREFKLNIGVFHNRYAKNIELCGICMPFKYSSKPEFEIIDYLKTIQPDIMYKHKDRSILNGKEIDILLPELKIGLEHNGVYWHSDLFVADDYHKNKIDLADEKNIHLVQIWGDDWLFKNDIVKSCLKNILRKNESIFESKTIIREVKYKDAKDFLNNNHLQGSVNASIRIGLFYNDELISLMVFGKLRKKLGYASKVGHYEMYRFCNKLNCNVVGGVSKLFKYFVRKYDPLFILLFADRMWSNGNIYEKLGFNFISNTEPDYFYVVDGMRQSRYKRTKQLGYSRIFGAGSKKYIWTNQ